MDKKKLEQFKKRLETRQQELRRTVSRTEQDGRNAQATGPDDERVVRGGSWYDRPFKCTASYRLPYHSWQKVYNVGFRIICEDDAQPLVRVRTRTP